MGQIAVRPSGFVQFVCFVCNSSAGTPLTRLFHTRNDTGRHSVCWSRSRFGKLKVPSPSRDDPAADGERTTGTSPWLHAIFRL